MGGSCFSFLAKFLVGVLRGYRKFLSVIIPPRCRFFPTCSQYAIEAINKYGAARGLYLTTKRILRCHPFGSSGYDPVP